MMGAGGLAIEQNDSKDVKESPAIPTVRSTRSEGALTKADVALEWSDMTIKFRVVNQDFPEHNVEEFVLFPNLGNPILK